MTEELISNVILQAPNFLGFLIAVYTLRQANRELLEYLRDCDCTSEDKKRLSELDTLVNSLSETAQAKAIDK